MKRPKRAALALSLMAMTFLATGYAADDPADKTANPPTATELARLKAQLDEQQKLIEQLSAALAAQRKQLDQVSASSAPVQPVPSLPSLGEVASTTPMVPKATPVPAPRVFEPQAPAAEASSPLQLKIGDATIMPVGFMDMTASFKDKNAGGSLGTNFGSIPYGNAPAARLTEFRFSPQNSRIGFRIDANFKGAHIIGYNEFDFLGTSGAFNISVTNGAFVPRARLYWVDVRKGAWEVLGGQSWSMLTPNRKGISALPGDLFYSQVVDVNYVIGLTWTRQPGVRFLYHPSDKATFGISLENPDQYIGGSGGGPTVVLPTALAGLANVQLDAPTGAAGAVQNIPNVHPDIIAKLAFDPSSHVHFEIAGIERTFKIWNANSLTRFTKAGGGGSINGNFEFAKGARLVTNNYWSEGGGRYLFGNAPDLILRSDGSISPIHAGGTVQGIEATVKNWLWYAYWSGIYVGKNTALDTNGSLVGYGYRGSANSNNRYVQEITIGFNQTIWKDAKWGALNLMGQWAYFFREPWFVAAGQPKAAHDNTIFMNLRYTLPGSAPAAK